MCVYLLRELREQLGLTQMQLAQRARVTQPTISRLELGRSSPTASEVQQLARALISLSAAHECEKFAAALREGESE